MIQSFFVYSFIALSMFMLFRIPIQHDCNGRILPKTNISYWFRACFGVLIFAFFVGVRWDVGIDQLSYLGIYNNLDNLTTSRLEPGFFKFMKIVHSAGASSVIFFAIIGILQLLGAISFFKEEKYIIPFFCICIICGGTFFSWCNIIRQQLVMSAFLSVISFFLVKKKLTLSVICILLLSSIHYSALMLIPLLALAFLNLENVFIKRKWQFLILFSALILAQLSFWESLLHYVDIILNFIGYDRYNMEVIMEVGSRTMAFGPRRIIFLLLDVFIIYHSFQMRRFYPSKTFGVAHILYVLLILIQPLFMNSLVFSRLVDYFVIYRMIMLAYLLFYLFNIRKRNSLIKGWFVILLLASHISIQIIADKGHHSDCIRYEFVWTKKTLI